MANNAKRTKAAPAAPPKPASNPTPRVVLYQGSSSSLVGLGVREGLGERDGWGGGVGVGSGGNVGVGSGGGVGVGSGMGVGVAAPAIGVVK